ncbi:hypothetical protein EN851_07930 [Mesorhizobium sp. M8A.F.Ca.ET.208.01.1.1]|uniref:hypothetical protein n=1 Tax=unclassified Mesorhizobium TaxID=325217 RepID=UPI001093B261|nr:MULTISPECIES: hypothetical protein [unclassified Mesorhizobium]TGQ95437.1 hypothetical protein EN851_07930 [Mesorhizobium sp. M8A.F.Ca.ET.208.01.1.1]TGT55928.1 hypothetical protein EN810_07930 [Mesorhizobium sp. M8A.F.Ca.ET.167.01.1.1]
MKRAAAILLILIALTLAMITLLTIRPARADPVPCGPVKTMLDRLVALYQEFVVLTGQAAGSQVLVTLSPSGTFTVLAVRDGRACMVLAGEKGQFDNGT